MSVWRSKVLLGTALVLLPGALLMLPLLVMLYRRYGARGQQEAALAKVRIHPAAPLPQAQPLAQSLPPQPFR